MTYDSDIHHRRSIRLKGYGYSRQGLYFVTICVQNRECLFGRIEENHMALNHYGEIVRAVWDGLPSHYNNVKLDMFMVMPNHIHGIIQIVHPSDIDAGLKPASATKTAPLPEIVRALKTFSARAINGHRNSKKRPVWQRNYYEHIIRDEESYLEIVDYIQNNPQKWLEDTLFMPS